MAVKTLTRTTCDRCDNLIEEQPEGDVVKKDDHSDSPAPVLYIEATKFGRKNPIVFSDLCTKCEKRLAALLDQVELTKPDDEDAPPADPKPKAKAKPGNGSSSKKPATTGETTF
ncbi:MAG: hypothetical protein JRJ10_14520 [Deltaproteobacteria bacterium]|nr:hypothetical protein [Deltaproteobacteria bacterium]